MKRRVGAILLLLASFGLLGFTSDTGEPLQTGSVSASGGTTVDIEANCNWVVGISPTSDKLKVVLEADARWLHPMQFDIQAGSDHGGVPFAIGVTCRLTNVGNASGGSIGQSLVGPATVAAGIGEIERTALANVCVQATVLFTDGSSEKTDEECRPL